ncbi:DNA-directed RNA polymerase subunit alpha C-terminal domain-containing protein [Salmonella enterica]
MKARNYILTSEDEALITPSNLRMWADYEGDHNALLALRAMARKLLSIGNPYTTPMAVEDFLNSSVATLPVSVRTANVIANTGYTTVRQLFEGGSDYMMRQRNFGHVSHYELVELFQRFALVWPEGVCDAPKPETVETQIECPSSLYNDLLNAARDNLAAFELKHGRFAKRGKNIPEYNRLQDLVTRAEQLVGVANA